MRYLVDIAIFAVVVFAIIYGLGRRSGRENALVSALIVTAVTSLIYFFLKYFVLGPNLIPAPAPAA